MKIGVISDTHNYFDPRIPAAFSGVEHILHAGDVGLPSIILELEQIAPVTAVVGNTDAGLTLKEIEVVELAGIKFLVHHIVDVHSPSAILREAIRRHMPNVVVFGHTHKPFEQTIGKIRFFNPGYAGKSRFGMPRSLAVLDCENGAIKSQLEYL
jgi:putative phosphoesterase